MNDFVKIEVAREIMNFMIGRHGQKGYDKSNKMLMQLLEMADTQKLFCKKQIAESFLLTETRPFYPAYKN